MAAATPAELLAALDWRYATKAFDPDRRIPAETWQALLKSLVLAPSSFGLQPWRFLVIDDPALRETLRGHSWGQPQVTDADRMIVLAARTDVTEPDIDRWIGHLTASRGTTPDTLRGLRDVIVGFAAAMEPADRQAWNTRQVYLALGFLMTSAAVLGIDTCPLEGLDPAAYDRVLGLADSGYATAVACALGYRTGDDKYAVMPKVRFPDEDLVKTL